MIKKILILLVFLGVLAGLWTMYGAQEKAVAVITPQNAPAIQTVYATGTVEAERMIPVSPKIGARLMSLHVDEGSKVSAGDVLAQLEDVDLRQTLADFEAKRDLAEKYLARIEPLVKAGGVSKQMLDEAKASLVSAEASVEKAQAELSYLQLLAPEKGTIIRRDGEIGELVTVASPVFWINGGDKIRIETEVDEEDISLVEVGQNVLISADAYPGQIFEGKVTAITPKGDPVARSYRVRLGLDQETPLMIGMTAETNIITQEKESALMVPSSALKDGFIIKISGGAAEHQAVKTGIKTQDATEITKGLSPSDTVAQIYDATLLDSGKIRTRRAEWSPKKQD